MFKRAFNNKPIYMKLQAKKRNYRQKVKTIRKLGRIPAVVLNQKKKV